MKRNIISITGDLASGKGAVSEFLIEKLGYTVYRNGEYFRKLGAEMGMDVTTFNEYVKDHPEIDKQIEKSASDYAKDHDNFIIDARLGWYAVPESFKVFLQVDVDVAAQRAFNDPKRKATENFATVEEQKADLIKRFDLENKRYFEVYGVHKEDLSNYDFVVDTTNLTIEEVGQKVLEAYQKWLEE
jgi:cytidylate kinase